jgi:hypothetical protein
VRLAADDECLLHGSPPWLRWPGRPRRRMDGRRVVALLKDRPGEASCAITAAQMTGRGRGGMIAAWICPRLSPGWWTRPVPRPALGLCRPLGRSVLISGAVAAETTTPLVPLGEHVLRGIAAPCTIFTLPDA